MIPNNHLGKQKIQEIIGEAQEYKVKGIPNGILKILQEKVKTNLGAFGYYFPKIHDCYLL